MLFGPLSQLRLSGTICPCLQKDDEKSAKASDEIISELCQSIQWHQVSERHDDEKDDNEKHDNGDENSRSGGSGGSGGSSGVGAFGFLTKMIPKVSAAASSTMLGNRPIIVDAKCELIDSPGLFGGSKGVLLEIVRTSEVSTSSSSRKAFAESTRIPLKRIKAVRPSSSTGASIPGWTNINSGEKLSTVYSSSCIISFYGKQNEELARLEITALEDESDDGDGREDVVQHFNNILEWDRNRRRKERSVLEEEEEEEEGGSQKRSLLRSQAEKATHFAKREIELQQMKREREKKKAMYLKDSGGLKYTALAMANRQG